MLEAVVFDMDGLMIDSEVLAKDLWSIVMKENGYSYEKDFGLTLIGKNFESVKELFLAKYGNDFPFKKMHELVMERKKEYIANNGLPVKPGLYELLSFLEEKQIKKAVASSSNLSVIEHNLEVINLTGKFDAIVAGNQVKHGKPHPEIFITACNKMNVLPSNVIVLEDSVPGVQAASDGKMKVILVPDLAKHDETSIAKTYAVCKDLNEVIEIIKNLI